MTPRPTLAWRPVGAIAALTALVLLFVTAGQPYYSFGLPAALFSVGAVPTVAVLGRTAGRRVLFGVGLVVNCGVAIVMSLPVLPIGVIGRTPIPAINVGIADEVGWPRYVAQVKRVYDGLPAEDRAHTVLVTGNYGEAGSLDRYGKPLGLPDVYSGQNELWYLGPPPESATVALLVFQDDPSGAKLFGSCVEMARLDNGYGVENEEQTARVYVCRDRTGTWAELWPRFQHFD